MINSQEEQTRGGENTNLETGEAVHDDRRKLGRIRVAEGRGFSLLGRQLWWWWIHNRRALGSVEDTLRREGERTSTAVENENARITTRGVVSWAYNNRVYVKYILKRTSLQWQRFHSSSKSWPAEKAIHQ